MYIKLINDPYGTTQLILHSCDANKLIQPSQTTNNYQINRGSNFYFSNITLEGQNFQILAELRFHDINEEFNELYDDENGDITFFADSLLFIAQNENNELFIIFVDNTGYNNHLDIFNIPPTIAANFDNLVALLAFNYNIDFNPNIEQGLANQINQDSINNMLPSHFEYLDLALPFDKFNGDYF